MQPPHATRCIILQPPVLVRRNMEDETHRHIQPRAHRQPHLLGYSVTGGVASVDETHLAKGLQKQKTGFFVELKKKESTTKRPTSKLLGVPTFQEKNFDQGVAYLRGRQRNMWFARFPWCSSHPHTPPPTQAHAHTQKQAESQSYTPPHTHPHTINEIKPPCHPTHTHTPPSHT